MTIQKVNLAEKFGLFSEQWSPKLVGTVDDYSVKIAKVQGEFVWHHHEHEDELFFVVQGRLTIRLRDGEIVLAPGEMVVIPKGVEHQPFAEEETHILMFERNTTLNTGNVESERTVKDVKLI